MPISHVSLATGASRFAAMRAFYLESLAVLGYGKYVDVSSSSGSSGGGGGGLTLLGLGPAGGAPDFWLHVGNGEQEPLPKDLGSGGGGGDVDASRPGRTHVAFEADTRELVDRWFEVAVKAGGIPNGPPGVRKDYSPNYYAAFVLDPLGNNIEVLNYRPVPKQT